MSIRSSQFLSFAKPFIKPIARYCDPLDQKFSIKNYEGAATDKKIELLKALSSEIKMRKQSMKTWNNRVFYLGCVQTLTLIAIVAIGYSNIEIPKPFSQKKMISFGPKLQVTVGMFSTLTISKKTFKYIVYYRKMQLAKYKSREKKFTKVAFLETLQSRCNSTSTPRCDQTG